MHKEAVAFIQFMKSEFWEFFTNGANVLDVGSGDVNGNNRQFFDSSCYYQGNDVFPGRNVDLVYKTTELPFFKPTFSTIISTECFEHDPEYVESLRKIVSILKPGGMFVFSCASTGRPEHGTRKTTPIHSFGTRGKLSKWQDYYKNLTFKDISDAIPLDTIFTAYRCYYDKNHGDLMFWGIKNGVKIPFKIPEYVAEFTERVAEFPETEPKQVPIQVLPDVPKPVQKTDYKLNISTFSEMFPTTTDVSSKVVHPLVSNIQSTKDESVPSLHKIITYDELTNEEKELVNSYLRNL
jgi:SAM-dependent methyltransferase